MDLVHHLSVVPQVSSQKTKKTVDPDVEAVALAQLTHVAEDRTVAALGIGHDVKIVESEAEIRIAAPSLRFM